MKLTSEFQAVVKDFLSEKNFENCGHSRWVEADSDREPIYDDVSFSMHNVSDSTESISEYMLQYSY